jgi:hypothetical protein
MVMLTRPDPSRPVDRWLQVTPLVVDFQTPPLYLPA